MNKETKIFTIALVVIALLFIGSIMFLWDTAPPPEQVIEYNYFTFEQEGGLWKTTLTRGNQPYEIHLRFNPQQVERVVLNGSTTRAFFQPPIHITFDPDEHPDNMKYLALGGAELSLNIVKALGIDVKAACTKNLTDACIDRPILTCENKNTSIIHMRIGEPAGVYQQGRCIIVQGTEFDLLKSIDRLLYHWYGIINPRDIAFNQQFNQSIEQYRERMNLIANLTNET